VAILILNKPVFLCSFAFYRVPTSRLSLEFYGLFRRMAAGTAEVTVSIFAAKVLESSVSYFEIDRG
jgi:hypothetical protein